MTNFIKKQSSTSVRFEGADDDVGSNPRPVRPIGEIIQTRLSRRTVLKGLMAGSAALATGALFSRSAFTAAQAAESGISTLTFDELAHGVDKTHAVAKGYDAKVLIRWGDALTKDAPAFDPARQSADAQEKQFGYNNDFVGFMPLPLGSSNAEHGLLCINHEYTNADLMFHGLNAENLADKITKDMVEIELAAHGHSVVEVKKQEGKWTYIVDSPYNRRITMRSTELRVSGPVAGHERLKTRADPTGTVVIGTLNNCAGGKTPWGAILTCEENFHKYFSGDPQKTPEARNYQRYGIKGKPEYPWWGTHVGRFDIEQEPNEPNRFGWVVELDPYDPNSVPVKRTALGRFKHEGATTAINKDGRVVVYSGDDERFDYVYKFVTAKAYDAGSRDANRDLLDEGTLYVGKFHDDGRLTWLPLVFGQGPLNPENGFAGQADVLIETRRAADLLGATPMDRPEDVQPNPVNGIVYMTLTNNTKRKPEQVNAANPRPDNAFGHIIAMVPPGAGTDAVDHAASEFTWELPILAGNPEEPAHAAKYHPATSENGWFAAPDNVAFDGEGRLWIATDQGSGWTKTGFADGIYACDVAGEGAYLTRHFFRVPVGAELCGPEFTPDDKVLFVAVQHPAADGVKDSTFDSPATRWPDFQEEMPPRPSIVVITKDDGGVIGG